MIAAEIIIKGEATGKITQVGEGETGKHTVLTGPDTLTDRTEVTENLDPTETEM